MQASNLNAIFFIAITALSTAATGQNAYKCGTTYSQLPCPGALVVDATDQRSSAQKIESDLATQRAVRTAQAMQQARLQQEKRELAANTPAVTPASAGQASSTRPSQAKKKKKGPDYFTAQVPGGKKKKQSAKKRTGNKAPRTS